MDWDYYFYKMVLEPYRIEEILTPRKYPDGEIDNVNINALRISLDNCFDEVESYSLQEKLIEFIDDYWYNVVSNIISQRRKIKLIKKKIKSLKKENPNSNSLKGEKAIKEIDTLQWELSQEEFILMFLKEQRPFLRVWASQKSAEFREIPEKERLKKEIRKNEIKELTEKLKVDHYTNNKYPNIFLNAKAYLIFKDYTDKINKYELTEYSFIYRIMYEKGLINNIVKESVYRKWLGEEFDQYFIKIKLLHSMELSSRLVIFNTLMDKYKPYTS